MESWLHYCIGHINASVPPLCLLIQLQTCPCRRWILQCSSQKQELGQVFYHLVCELTQAGLLNSHKTKGELQRVNLFSFCCSPGIPKAAAGQTHLVGRQVPGAGLCSVTCVLNLLCHLCPRDTHRCRPACALIFPTAGQESQVCWNGLSSPVLSKHRCSTCQVLNTNN